jgi:hypothetical protein
MYPVLTELRVQVVHEVQVELRVLQELQEHQAQVVQVVLQVNKVIKVDYYIHLVQQQVQELRQVLLDLIMV